MFIVPLEGSKRSTLLKRNLDRIKALSMFIQHVRVIPDPDCIDSANLLPKLAYHVVMELLDECDVPHVCGTRNAKLQTAELAVLLDCPIVSDNSDFYIFQSPVPSRYRVIPLSLFNSACDQLPTKCADCDSQSTTCYGVSCSVFCQPKSSLNKVTPTLLPLLGVLLDNNATSNVHTPDSVQLLIKKTPKMPYGAKRVHAVLRWLSQFTNNSSGALHEILSGYSSLQLNDITKQIAQCIRGYFLDPVTGGSELANEINLPSDTAFTLRSPRGNQPVNFDSFSVNTVDEAVSLLCRTLSHCGRISALLIDALYVRGGSVLRILYEDLKYANSIYTVDLEYRIGCSHKLRWLTDGQPVESYREGRRMSTFSVKLPVATVPRCQLALESFDRFFSQYLSIDLSSMVSDSSESMGIICMLIVWLRHASVKEVAQMPAVRNPVALAFVTCALLTIFHYEYLRGRESTVADKKVSELCKGYGQVASDAKRESVKSGHQCYAIEVVHQPNELQLVYVELQHLTHLLEVLCPCSNAEEDPTGGDSAPADERRLSLWPGWVMFSSGRLLHWLAQALACAPPDDGFERLQNNWIPFLLRAVFCDITPPSVSELSTRVSDLLKTVQRVLIEGSTISSV
ncbi:unnamed protein product [Dicrocoelium dendriticum]|nr:unnamed protein product [Dicrocoelium dendriticum]